MNLPSEWDTSAEKLDRRIKDYLKQKLNKLAGKNLGVQFSLVILGHSFVLLLGTHRHHLPKFSGFIFQLTKLGVTSFTWPSVVDRFYGTVILKAAILLASFAGHGQAICTLFLSAGSAQ